MQLMAGFMKETEVPDCTNVPPRPHPHLTLIHELVFRFMNHSGASKRKMSSIDLISIEIGSLWPFWLWTAFRDQTLAGIRGLPAGAPTCGQRQESWGETFRRVFSFLLSSNGQNKILLLKGDGTVAGPYCLPPADLLSAFRVPCLSLF